MATRTSPELPRARCVRFLALDAEMVLITSATVGGNKTVAQKVPLFVAPIVDPKCRRPRKRNTGRSLLG
eukprot:13560797-Alexandrium_andersonii.AAC.1